MGTISVNAVMVTVSVNASVGDDTGGACRGIETVIGHTF